MKTAIKWTVVALLACALPVVLGVPDVATVEAESTDESICWARLPCSFFGSQGCRVHIPDTGDLQCPNIPQPGYYYTREGHDCKALTALGEQGTVRCVRWVELEFDPNINACRIYSRASVTGPPGCCNVCPPILPQCQPNLQGP